jgi:hypothetical protein
MKVTRRQLKNIIKEFLDVSAKPATQTTSAYDQATNAERAAFISAMGIAEKASKKGKIDNTLSEGPMIPFRPRATNAMTMNPEEEAEIFDFPAEDMDGDITPEEMDTYDLDEDHLETFKSQVANAKNKSLVPPMSTEEEEDLDDEFESYLQGLESGAVEDLYPNEYDDIP